MVPATQIVEAARSLLGVPYLHQGHSELGVDCLGFLYVAARRAGIALTEIIPPVPFTHNQVSTPRLLAYLNSHCLQLAKPTPGALILFQFPKAPHPQHFAICAGKTMIHAHQSVGRVIEHGYRASWVTWTHSLWAFPGVVCE